jgi:hypothetical protein
MMILYAIFFMLAFFIVIPGLSVMVVKKSESLSRGKPDWPLNGSLMIWLLFFVGGFIFMLLDRHPNGGLNLFLWLWRSFFGILPALIQGIYAIRKNIDKRYFTRLDGINKLEIRLQYLKQLQDKWSSQLTWFMTIFVALAVSAVLAIINLGHTDTLKDQMLYQWFVAFGYGLVGVLFEVI